MNFDDYQRFAKLLSGFNQLTMISMIAIGIEIRQCFSMVHFGQMAPRRLQVPLSRSSPTVVNRDPWTHSAWLAWSPCKRLVRWTQPQSQFRKLRVPGDRLPSARDPVEAVLCNRNSIWDLCSDSISASIMGALYSMNNGYLGSLNAAESCVRLRLWLLSWHFASSEAATGISCGSSLWGSPSGGLQHSVAKLFGKPPSWE